MKYTLVVAILFSLSFGLITESFRYQSTAGLWEDDYDLLFDPARISEIKGARLWTSLSNFVTGTEEPFSNGSVPYILLGGSKNLGKLYPGMVYDRSVDKTPLNTGLVDPYGNPIYGDGEVTEIDWNDPDGNGVYDSRVTETESRSAYNIDKDNDFYIGTGYKMNNLRLGLGFMHRGTQFIDTDPDNNFTYDYSFEDLTTNTVISTTQADFAGDNKTNISGNEIIFSGWMDKGKMSLGLTASYDMLGWKDEAIILGDTAIYTRTSDTTEWFVNASILDSTDLPQSGSVINIELKSFYNYSENGQGRFYLGFYTESFSYGDGAIGKYYKTRERINPDFTWDTITTTTDYYGDGGSNGIRLGTKQLFTVSERLKFGIGVIFSTASYTDSMATKDTTVSIRRYDDNDGVIFDPDDYVQTTWSSETWMIKTTGALHILSFPVGLEFYLTQPLVFRLGAIHTYTIDDYTTVTDLIQYEPQRVRKVDGTGTVTETMVDPPQQPVGSEETNVEKTPTTDYFYGIGWKVNENLQIDLMGFNRLTDLSNWKLSATLKF